MVTILGYVAYAFICLFNPIQLLFMVRRKNVNLGAWPLASLVLGLALLSVSFWYVAVPTYVIVGTAVSLLGCAANLLLVLRQPKPNPRVGSTLERYAERTLRANTFDISTFFKFITRRKGTPLPMGNKVDFAAMSPLREVEPPTWVEKRALEDCKTCGCLLSSERSTPVEVCVFDIGFVIAREGKSLPEYKNLVHPVRYDFYCLRDRPAYDRVVYVPQLGGETVLEYFKRTMSDVEFANMKDAHGAVFTPTEPFRQVTEAGDQYD